MPFQSVTFYKSVVYGRLFLWILKTNIFLYKINKCSETRCLYRFIGLIMQTYRKYVWKICSINRETNIGQGGWILCGIQRAAGRQYWQKEDM